MVVDGVGPQKLTNMKLMRSLSVSFGNFFLVPDSLLHGELSSRDDSVGIFHGLQEELLVDTSLDLGMLRDCRETFSN